MLGMKTYAPEYIDACRAQVDADLAAYRGLASTTTAFEAAFFANEVLVLETMFMHRLRVVEGKDGNALNEVRVLAQSILEHGNVMTADKTIRLIAAKSVLGIEFGDEVRLSEAGFVRLSKAFFDEIEARFSAAAPAGAR